MRFTRNKFKYAKRRVLNAAEALKRDKFVEAALAGDKDLFEELKRFKGVPQKVSSKVDGHTDPDSIADHLRISIQVFTIEQDQRNLLSFY